MIDFSSTGLPLVSHLPRISEALARNRSLVLTAEPGAGKSTLVPPYLMDEGWLRGLGIVMLEPRRLAAVSVAARIAELLGEPVGRRAGYRVRTSSRVSGDTRIEVVTEALLTRRIQDDPLLQGVGLVIFDELHERSLHADLALALTREVRRARPDLAVLAMSATLDTDRVAGMLGAGSAVPAPCLHCPGTAHPVTTEHRPLSRSERWEEEFADGVASLFDRTDGGILAFLPGAGEIRRTGARLAGVLGARAQVLPLHGTLRLEDQRRVVAAPAPGPDASRRVILATSIAETSLTVPGIRVVADSGWSRLSRYHPATGLDRLATERVSTSSAEQRRGRAGRLGPGLCVRFWPESETLLSRPDPEILRSDLCGLVLECALWGARSPGELEWLDAPPGPSFTQAGEVLRMLGLLDRGGVTDLGRAAAGLGLAPRLAALVLRGAGSGQQVLAAACAAILQDRDGSEIPRDPDFRLRLELIRTGQAGAPSWRQSVETEIQRILRRTGSPDTRLPGWTAEAEEQAGALLAAGFPDRLARREPDGTYRLVTGRAARFPGSGPGAGSRVAVPSRAAAAWIVALDADPGETTGTIRLAAPLGREEAERVLSSAAEEELEIRWEGLVPKGVLSRRAGRLVLSERPASPSPDDVALSFARLLSSRGLGILPWNSQSTRLLARMRFHSRVRSGQPLGDMTDAGLVSAAGEWLVPFLRLSGGQVISAGGLLGALQSLLGRERHRMDAEVPESITLPTGGRRSIQYEASEPYVEARIQEVFGLAASPRVCGVPITFRLLSPAHRPLQVTNDLAHFWGTTYAEVRREMRGRYPKHYWPEDPRTATPTSGVRPKKRE